MCEKFKPKHDKINEYVTQHDTCNLFNKYILHPIITHLTRLLKFNMIIHKTSLINTCKYVQNELKLDLKY